MQTMVNINLKTCNFY